MGGRVQNDGRGFKTECGWRKEDIQSTPRPSPRRSAGAGGGDRMKSEACGERQFTVKRS